MQFINKEHDFEFNPDLKVSVSYQGNITKVVSSSFVPGCKIKILNEAEREAYNLDHDKKYYMLLDSGEIKECSVAETRGDNVKGVIETLDRLKGIINANVTDPTRVHWLTLTYSQPDGKPMTDVKRLRIDFQNCMRALRADYPDRNIDFIRVYEPQRSGAWHLHVILIWDGKRPYINSNVFRRKYWNHGFVTLQGVDANCDNIGEYFGVYLTDVRLDELDGEPDADTTVIEREGKKYAKGERLKYYPAGTNFYGCSRGIKMPEEVEAIYSDLDKSQWGALTYKERRIFLLDNGKIVVYEYEYYNRKRTPVTSADDELEKLREKIRLSKE